MVTQIMTAKLFLVSMVLSMTLGTVATKIHIRDQEFHLFAMTMVGGTVGMLVSLACYGADDVKQLSRHGITNLGVAVLFGPIVSMWVAHYLETPMTQYLVIATSGTLGIGGMAILRLVGPIIASVMTSGLKNALETVLRIRTGKPDDEDKK